MKMYEWLNPFFFEGGFGLEMENQRVTPEGFLADTPHPFGDNLQLDRDFCESQLEMITGVHHTPLGAVEELEKLKKEASEKLLKLETGPEYLWPFSVPPYLRDEKDIHIAQFSGVRAAKTSYRNHLARVYGRKLQSLCGIHFNFSFPESFVKALRDEGKDPDQAYLNLAGNIMRYGWVLVALTAASPVYDSSYDSDGHWGETVSGSYASIRCSERGYWNKFVPELSFESVDAYVDSIERYVDAGLISSSAELYYPVRLKPSGANDLSRLKNGVNHIELRMIDVNPLYPEGICPNDVPFMTVFMMYMMSLDHGFLTPEEQKSAIGDMKAASHYPMEDVIISWNGGSRLTDALSSFIVEMNEYLKQAPPDNTRMNMHYLTELQLRKIVHPEQRYTDRILKKYGRDYVKNGLVTAERYAEGRKEYE